MGTFTLYVRQFFNKEIEVTSEETAKPINNAVSEITNEVDEKVEPIQQNAVSVGSILALQKKNVNITDKLAKIKASTVLMKMRMTRKLSKST